MRVLVVLVLAFAWPAHAVDLDASRLVDLTHPFDASTVYWPTAKGFTLESVAHGVIFLETLPFEYGRARRRMRIVKIRGVAAVEGFHDFIIKRGGLEVFPQLVPSRRTTSRPEPTVTSGVTELDQLLGGGLTWGANVVRWSREESHGRADGA